MSKVVENNYMTATPESTIRNQQKITSAYEDIYYGDDQVLNKPSTLMSIIKNNIRRFSPFRQAKRKAA